MNGMDIILLHMLHSVQGERTVSGCYHILKGKKSAQAIQDAALYRYKSWFGILPQLDYEHVQAVVRELTHKNYIQRIILTNQPPRQNDDREKKEKLFYQLTTEGVNMLTHRVDQFRLHERGFFMEDTDFSLKSVMAFWSKFKLLSQVVSHSLHSVQRFIPVVDDLEIQNWFKRYWKEQRGRKEFTTQLINEVHAILDKMHDSIFPELIVSRLSGYNVTASTLAQLELHYQIPAALLHIFHLQAVATFYYEVRKKRDSCLYALCSMDQAHSKLTDSARKTYELLKRGHSLERIAEQRRLKISTVEDHIIEIVIHQPSFDITSFLSDQLLFRIKEVSHALGTKKLSDIRKGLDGQASYLQIRLALLKE